MVGVAENFSQETYATWEFNSNDPAAFIADGDSSTLSTNVSELRRAGLAIQRRAIQTKEQARGVRNNALFKIKESEVSVTDPYKNKSFVYFCCGTCTPTSRESFVNTASKQHQSKISNLLYVDRRPGILPKLFSCSSNVYSFKKYNYPRVTQVVLRDKHLQEAITQSAREISQSYDVPEKDSLREMEKRAWLILECMQSKISDVLLRIVAWTMYKFLPYSIQCAGIHCQQVETVKQASKSNLPLIFLPQHRSYLDYMLISFMALTNNIKCPLVAVGDNLRIPIFGRLMSGLGAFFVKRRVDANAGSKDALYRTTLNTYIVECLRAGHNLEFSIEGSRTRTGKPRMPQGGLLSVVVDAFVDGAIEDALLVPVSVNYDRLVDGNFVREQLGQPKKLETFGSAIKGLWNILSGNYGIVKVNVGQAISLTEILTYLQTHQNQLNENTLIERHLSSSSPFGTDVIEEHRQFVDQIARHVTYDWSDLTPIMSTNIVAFLLLNKFRDKEGCHLEKLVSEFDELRKELEWANRDLAFHGKPSDIVEHALEILGPRLVKQQKQIIKQTSAGQSLKSKIVTIIQPVYCLPNVIELSYYSNILLTHYVMDSILVTALHTILTAQLNVLKNSDTNQDESENKEIIIYQNELLSRALQICDILKFEFIFCKPCQNLEQVIIKTIENLGVHGVISRIEEDENFDEEQRWSKQYSKQFDESSDEEYEDEVTDKIKYKFIVNYEPNKQTERMEFLHKMLRPTMDTYIISAFCLRKLVGQSLSETDFVLEILAEIRTNFDHGLVRYEESFCVDPIKNSLKLFEQKKILECYTQKNVKLYYLKEEFDYVTAVNQVYETFKTFKY